jgi:hypothetical protein
LTFPFDFLFVDQTLTSHIFCILTPFEVIFVSLESYRRALHNDVVFLVI